MTLVLVRVEMGVSYDHNTSKTANSSIAKRLAPFNLAFNRTSKVG